MAKSTRRQFLVHTSAVVAAAGVSAAVLVGAPASAPAVAGPLAQTGDAGRGEINARFLRAWAKLGPESRDRMLRYMQWLAYDGAPETDPRSDPSWLSSDSPA